MGEDGRICFTKALKLYSKDEGIIALVEDVSKKYVEALNDVKEKSTALEKVNIKTLHENFYDYLRQQGFKSIGISTIFRRIASKNGKRTKEWTGIFFDSKGSSIKFEDDKFTLRLRIPISDYDSVYIDFEYFNYLSNVLSYWEVIKVGTVIAQVQQIKGKKIAVFSVPIKFCTYPLSFIKGEREIFGVDIGYTNFIAASNGNGKSFIYPAKEVWEKVERRLELISSIDSHIAQLKKEGKPTKSAYRRRKEHFRKMSALIETTAGEAVNQLLKLVKPGDIIVIEDLKWLNRGLAKKSRREQRRTRMKLPYRTILNKIKEKAEIMGVKVFTVDPEYTSQTCPICGHTDKGNRRGEKFVCKKCGYSNNADLIAAINIRNKWLSENPA